MPEMLPKINIPKYTENELQSLPEAARFAAQCGVEPRYLKFANPEFTDDPTEQYAIHPFSTLYIHNERAQKIVTYDEQYKNALKLIDSGMLWCKPSGLIIINSPYTFFDAQEWFTTKDLDNDPSPFTGAMGFLSHLICSLSHRVHKRVLFKKSGVLSINVNFFSTTFFDRKDYFTGDQHLLVWGPVTELTGDYEFSKTMQFLFAYRNHTRVLLTSTQDMGALLSRLRINADYVSYFFNFDKDKNGIVPKEKEPKSKRGQGKNKKAQAKQLSI